MNLLLINDDGTCVIFLTEFQIDIISFYTAKFICMMLDTVDKYIDMC